jgi:hypothetical protein
MFNEISGISSRDRALQTCEQRPDNMLRAGMPEILRKLSGSEKNFTKEKDKTEMITAETHKHHQHFSNMRGIEGARIFLGGWFGLIGLGCVGAAVEAAEAGSGGGVVACAIFATIFLGISAIIFNGGTNF